jgi:hypothetical protein
MQPINYHIKMTQKNKGIKDMILLNLNLNLHLLSILNLVYSRKGKLIRKGLPFKLRKKRMNIMRGRGKILMCMGLIGRIRFKCHR